MELSDLTVEQLDQILMDAEDFRNALPSNLKFTSGATTFFIEEIMKYFVDELFEEVHKRESVKADKDDS